MRQYVLSVRLFGNRCRSVVQFPLHLTLEGEFREIIRNDWPIWVEFYGPFYWATFELTQEEKCIRFVMVRVGTSWYLVFAKDLRGASMYRAFSRGTLDIED